ncbi:THAP domain-containing protein 2 [Frankliniella fusca]|uniref:THAP domain-containing protein 2 n=1 Tax=Frankliniella fusca TaxID=407009 RepID=A0AAE1LIS0_9NEOP|nr:THAP domain-containing protein 2 [Frankliniella fusca]
MDHLCYTRKTPKKKRERHNCCVPQCSELLNPSIRLHYAPSDPKRRREWAQAIRTGKELTKHMRVCSKHFRREDFLPTGTRSLKKTAVPSLNLPVRSHETAKSSPQKRKSADRADRARKRAVFACGDHQDGLERGESFDSTDGQTSDEDEEDGAGWIDIVEPDEGDIKKFESIGVQVGTYDALESFVKSLTVSDEKLFSTTGLPSVEFFDTLDSYFNKIAPDNPRKPFLLTSRQRILLSMMKIKLASSFSTLAAFFSISIQNACNYFYDTVRVLAQLLKCFVKWQSKETILNNMPKCFSHFMSTRVVLDCFELFVEKPKCVRCRIRLYSQYKKNYTVKILLGVAPSGAITKVSKAYGGRASDKFITSDSGLYDMCEYGDAIMVDKGFAIEEECLMNLLTMIRPPFMRQKGKFTRAEAVQCAKIARARVHVERVIQRIREYSMLKSKLQWRLTPYIDDVLIIVCALVNLSPPVLADDKFL